MAEPGERERTEAVRQSWPYRAIERTRGNQTLLGTILLSIIGRVASNPPTAGMTAIIDRDGVVRTNMVGRDHKAYVGVPIGTVEHFVANLRRLADDLQLADADRVAMFDQARKWVSHDFRVIGPAQFDISGNIKEI